MHLSRKKGSIWREGRAESLVPRGGRCRTYGPNGSVSHVTIAFCGKYPLTQQSSRIRIHYGELDCQGNPNRGGLSHSPEARLAELDLSERIFSINRTDGREEQSRAVGDPLLPVELPKSRNTTDHEAQKSSATSTGKGLGIDAPEDVGAVDQVVVLGNVLAEVKLGSRDLEEGPLDHLQVSARHLGRACDARKAQISEGRRQILIQTQHTVDTRVKVLQRTATSASGSPEERDAKRRTQAAPPAFLMISFSISGVRGFPFPPGKASSRVMYVAAS